MGVAEENEMVSDAGSNKTNKNLSKLQKLKNFIILSNIGINNKNTGVLTFKVSTAFT